MGQITQTIEQQQTIADTLGSWSQDLSFAQFSPSLGTLLNINVGLAGDVTGSILLENLEAAPATFAVSLPGWINLLGPDGTPLASVAPDPATSVTLGAFDGTVDYAGNSGTVLADLTSTATQDVVLQPGSTGIPGFIGTGSVDLPVIASTSLQATGPANMQILSHASAGAVVTLSEDYSPPQDTSGGADDVYMTSAMFSLGSGFALLSAGGSPYLVTSTPQTLTVADQTTGWTDSLAAQQFDPTLGLLAQVNLTLSSDIQASVAAENLDPGAASLFVQQTATVTLNAPGAAGPLSTQASVKDAATLGAFDGSMDFAGLSGQIDQGLTATSGFAPQVETVTGDLWSYTGTGTIDLPIVSSSTASIDGPGNLLARLQAQGGATATVSYTYQPLPFISDAGNTAAYTLGGTVAADPGIALSEPAVPMLSGASVAVTGGALVPLSQPSSGTFPFVQVTNADAPPSPPGGDALAADTAGTDILAFYDPASEVLTLTGTASVADYQKVLRSVTFSSTVADPSAGGSHTSRTLTWSATDEYGDTAIAANTTIAIPAQSPAWTNDAGGDWATGSNWSSSPNAPAASQGVVITDPGTYSVTVSALQSVQSVTLDAPGATVVLDAPLDVSAGFTLEAGTLSFDGGTLSVGSFDQTGGLLTGQTVDINASGTISLAGGSIVANTVTLMTPSGLTGPTETLGQSEANTPTENVVSTGNMPLVGNVGPFTLGDSGSLVPTGNMGSTGEIAPVNAWQMAQQQMQFIPPQAAPDSGLISPVSAGFDPAQLAMYDPTDSGSVPDWRMSPLTGLPDDAAPACILLNASSGNWVDVALQQPGALNSGVAVAGGDRDSLVAFLANMHASLG